MIKQAQLLTRRRSGFIHGLPKIMDIVNIIKMLKQQQVFRYAPQCAVINIVGIDARTFLQRMSTNDMMALSRAQAVQTCFLNNKGRVFDYVTVFEREDHDFVLVGTYKQQSALLDWLEQFHFVEDFTLSILEQTCEWTIALSGKLDSPLWRSHDFDFSLSLGFSNYPELDEQAWEFLRINALMPQAPEVNLGLMPQNIGLKALVAENKGCYVGQEVVAKALTYQKHAKSLCGVKVNLEIFLTLHVGDCVKDSLGRTGIISSLAPVYVPGYIQALAVVDDKLGSEGGQAEFIFSKN